MTTTTIQSTKCFHRTIASRHRFNPTNYNNNNNKIETKVKKIVFFIETYIQFIYTEHFFIAFNCKK